MKFNSTSTNLVRLMLLASAISFVLILPSRFLATQQTTQTTQQPTPPPVKKEVAKVVFSPSTDARQFDTPQQAADALVKAAEDFDVTSLLQIFGPSGGDVIFSGEMSQDRQQAADFVTQAREKKRVSVDPKNGNRAYLLVGTEDWPFPVPLVKRGAKWHFDSVAGREELVNRRIGANELDAIQICHGYVEAQYEYAHQPREGYVVNQFA